MSPRCLIKIDFKKACDFIECPFLYDIMVVIDLPKVFINWVMFCVTIVSYYIMLKMVSL